MTLTHVRCGRNEHIPPRQQAAGPLQIIGHAGAPVHFPLERTAGRGFLKALEERQTLDGEGIPCLQARQSGHELTGTPFLDAEQNLDRASVEVAGVQSPQRLQNCVKSMKPRWLSRHNKISPISIR